MKKILLGALALAITSGSVNAIPAPESPSLNRTNLYTTIARECHVVDLSTWSHPTKLVLNKYKVPLTELELCNDKRYPVFHVVFPYDPLAKTDDFFLPFYADMLAANGRNPMAFVEETSGNAIVEISNPNGRLTAVYEQYVSQ